MNKLRSLLLILPLALSAQVSTFPPASSTPGGDAVGGASNLTTPGGVPFVNTAGVLNIDATKLFWNNTTKRLGIGSASPLVELDVTGSGHFNTGLYVGGGAGNASIGYYDSAIRLANNWSIRWSSTAGANGTVDLGLSRASAGLLRIDDGGTAVRDLMLRRMQLGNASGATCDSSGRFTFEATAGGAGVADTVKVCTKDATDTYSMVPLGGGTTIAANPTVTFTSQTSVTFTHNLSTDTPIIQCYDASGSRLWIEPSQITSTSTNVSTITFTSSQSGKCVANATGGGGGGGTPGGSSGQIQYNSSGSFAGATVGNGLTLASGTLSVDVATVPEFLTASATLNFGVIATATCGEQTITLTGAASQDGIFLGPPADLDAGLAATAYISATNTATIRLCKITSGSTASINKNFRVTVVRGR